MRTLIIFALLALSFSFTPEWADCGSTLDPSKVGFQTTSVEFSKPPKRNIKEGMTLVSS